MDLFKRKNKPPTLKEEIKEETAGQLKLYEATTPGMFQGLQFDFQAIDDEKILFLIDPESPIFEPLCVPLIPLLSRLNYLSNCSEAQARAFCLHVDTMITRLKNRAKKPEQYYLLDGLRAMMFMRINDSVNGFKIRVLSETRKVLTVEEGKPGAAWWRRK